MSNSKRVAGKLFGGALLAGAAFGYSASQAQAKLMLDVVVHGAAPGSEKVAQVAAVGDTVVLDVYANIVGAGINSASFANAYYTVSTGSAAGGVTGSLTGNTVPALFQGTGFQIGKPWDLDGDSTIDLIGDNPAASAGANWIWARNPAQQDGFSHLIGSVTYTVKSVGAAQATVGLTSRKKTGALIVPASFTENGTLQTYASNAQPDVGAPVVIKVGGEPPVKYILKLGAAEGQNLGAVSVASNANGYLSQVADITNGGAGNVQVTVTGPGGPAGPVFAMLWLASGALDAGKLPDGVSLVTSGALFDEMHAAGSLYTKLAGKPFDAMVQLPGNLVSSFFDFDLKNDAQIDRVAVIPEPASLSLLGLGAASLLMARRRRA